ncbi:hypothetical protein [Pseudoxanthomonas suwonensis]|uniref:hypothetical protein n=1 Tax=Pseudoxanthomonas suwonensis TaxID=314722 RepID=UPI00138EE2FE|nr:hypothetical protein [Pseudoxanthomonas suwonensis]KAF1704035.1 hypothetical protein CSC68_03490 [Pseudoxanthomonas suwonensis]
MSDEITARIDRAARAFNEAASELALAMLGKLEKDEPELAAKVAQALERGERMVVALEMDPARPSIWWASVDDYEKFRRIMTIPCGAPN